MADGSSSTDAMHRVEQLFAEFVELHGRDPSLGFDDWVRRHPETEPELRRVHADWVSIAEALGHGERPRLEAGFELRGELGSGAFGVVFRAWDRLLKREVALKVLRRSNASAAALSAFVREAQRLASVRHPNVVRIHGVDLQEQEIRLQMDLIEGRTLHDVVESDGVLSCEEAAQVGMQVCRALAAIHSQGLIHMDVKPGNIMREQGGAVILLDFGLARPELAAGRDQPRGGSPPFMAPEVVENDAIGPQADLFSLGVTLYWLVAGRSPYRTKDSDELIQAIRAADARPLLDVRPDAAATFAAVVARAMQHRPADRFSSAGAMEEALRATLHPAGEERAASGRRWRGFPSTALIGSAVLCASAVLMAWRYGIIGGEPAAVPAVEARFLRVDGAGGIPLGNGDVVRVGDRVRVEIRSDHPVFVYLFNEDDRGLSYRLLPKGDATLVEPDSWHGFPRGGSEAGWQITTEAGAESLVLIAAPQRVPFAEVLLNLVPLPESVLGEGVAVGQLTRSEVGQLRAAMPRGFGVEVTGSASRESPRTLVQYLEEFRHRLSPADGVFVRTLTLRH